MVLSSGLVVLLVMHQEWTGCAGDCGGLKWGGGGGEVQLLYCSSVILLECYIIHHYIVVLLYTHTKIIQCIIITLLS